MMERIRARLEKGDSIRYISHLDYVRAIDRAVRRAGIPIAYSEGFHPHARIAFGPALAVGIASVAEFADFELADCLGAGEFTSRMNSVLPAGLSILESRSIPTDWKPLSVAIVAASYRLVIAAPDIEGDAEWRGERGAGRPGSGPGSGARALERLERAVREVLEARSLIVRRSKERYPGGGATGERVEERDVDIRPSLLGLRLARGSGYAGYAATAAGCCVGLDALVRLGGGAGSVATARPDEILSVLAMHGGIARGMELASITRTGLYVSRDGRLLSPMEFEGDMSSPQGTY